MVHQIGAVLYILWGVLHLAAAGQGFRLASGADAGEIKGRLYQNAWHLLTISLAVIGVAVALNWTNSETGYWINLALASAADVGFILFILMPGHIRLFPGVIGPVLWVLAAGVSTYALFGGGA